MMKWRSVADDPPPIGYPVVVWSPYSAAKQQLFETSREGVASSWYWMNEYGNGGMPDNFKPEWWSERPKPPPGIIDPALKLHRFMRRVRSGTIKRAQHGHCSSTAIRPDSEGE